MLDTLRNCLQCIIRVATQGLVLYFASFLYTPSATAAGMSCTEYEGNPVTMRSSGITELVGDVVIQCTGGTPTPAGQPIPVFTITVSLNAPVTSRLLNSSGLSEATLLIDEPYPSAPIPTPIIIPPDAPPQIFCVPANAPCAETGTGGSPSPYASQPNVFLGKQTGNNTITFASIPIDPPGSRWTRAIRITNLRVNVSQLPLALPIGYPTPVNMSLTVVGTAPITVPPTQLWVAFTQFPLGNAVVPVSLSACGSHNASLIGGSGTPAFDFKVSLYEGFASVFRRRNAGLTTNGVTAPSLYPQNVPGFFYNNESGFYVPSLFTGFQNVGLADFGTRIRISFSNVGSGVHLFVPLTIPLLLGSGTPSTVINEPMPVTGIAVNQLRLVVGNPDGTSTPGFTSAAASSSVSGVPVAEVSYSGGRAYALYEVENATPYQIEFATIPVAMAFTGPEPLVTPGAGIVNVSLAPAGGQLASIQTADILAPVPRFADDSFARFAYSIDPCTPAPLTVTTNPPGLSILVDGVQYASPQPFYFFPNTLHTVDVLSPQPTNVLTRYAFRGWSDNGARNHDILVGSSPSVLTATFAPQYALVLSVLLAFGGVPGSLAANPPTSDGYYDSGTKVQVTATPNPDGIFSFYSVDYRSVGTNPTTVTMDSPHIVAAEFIPYSFAPRALNFTIGNNLTPSPPQIVSVYSERTLWTVTSSQSNIKVSPSSGYSASSPSRSFSFQVSVTNGASGILKLFANNNPAGVAQIPVNISTSAASYPYGSFDTPVDSTGAYAGAIAVTGWALDDGQVTGVEIWREPVLSEAAASNGLVFIGNAVFVPGARPDIVTAYPNASNNNRAGWGYLMLTTSLPNNTDYYESKAAGNGYYKLHAIARNAAGTSVRLEVEQIQLVRKWGGFFLGALIVEGL
ncbi:MAG: hypothetical protein HY235_20540 [Acidobacteria bacterium]|nr:hypothetical protein [Acidobacteriota bacterium]